MEPIRYKYLRSVYTGRGLSVPPRVRWGLVLIALALYAVNFVAGERGIIRKAQLRRELKQVQAENVRLAAEKERLQQEVLLKKNDPFSLERVAREKYMMVGPDEVIYRFDDEQVQPEDLGLGLPGPALEGASPEPGAGPVRQGAADAAPARSGRDKAAPPAPLPGDDSPQGP